MTMGKEKTLMLLFLFILIIGVNNTKAQDTDSSGAKIFIRQALTSLQQKDYEKSREYALKALEIDPDDGEAYILIGAAYVNSAEICSSDRFSKGMIFCLAVDMFEKAKEVDKSLTEKAEKLIKVYSKYFPSKEEIFIEPVEGQKYKIGCWIKRETTVRFSNY